MKENIGTPDDPLKERIALQKEATRRWWLRTVGFGTVAPLAGCLGDDNDNSEDGAATDDTDNTDTDGDEAETSQNGEGGDSDETDEQSDGDVDDDDPQDGSANENEDDGGDDGELLEGSAEKFLLQQDDLPSDGWSGSTGHDPYALNDAVDSAGILYSHSDWDTIIQSDAVMYDSVSDAEEHYDQVQELSEASAGIEELEIADESYQEEPDDSGSYILFRDANVVGAVLDSPRNEYADFQPDQYDLVAIAEAMYEHWR